MTPALLERGLRTQSHAVIVENFPVAPERLWDAIVDHEGMSRWIGARVSLVSGPKDGLVGAVRRVQAPGLSIDEEVIYADAPRRLVYRICAGLPVLDFHRGEILIEPWGQTGARLTWDIRLSSKVPGVAALMVAVLGPAVRKGLRVLRRQLAPES